VGFVLDVVAGNGYHRGALAPFNGILFGGQGRSRKGGLPEMMENFISLREALSKDRKIGDMVDKSLSPPSPFRGTGQIRLIILGQDPTVKKYKSREVITTVLNLNRAGPLRGYLETLCFGLGLCLDANVYATNYANVFFTQPPNSIREVDILRVAASYCLPHLLEEIQPFSAVPILSLGEPLLRHIAAPSAPRTIRHYWGYAEPSMERGVQAFSHLPAGQNVLTRVVFPFPHQPTVRKVFYSERLAHYLAYVKSQCFV
jgi:uracil-DNA glycosylase